MSTEAKRTTTTKRASKTTTKTAPKKAAPKKPVAKQPVAKKPAAARTRAKAPAKAAAKAVSQKTPRKAAPKAAHQNASQNASQNTPQGSPQALSGGPAEILGQVTWLIMSSPVHKHLFVTDFEWLVVPPVLQRQFRIFRRDNVPVAYVSWALVNEEVEQRLVSGVRKLAPGDWKSGDRPWLVDLVTPFGGAENFLADLKAKVFPDRPLKTLRPTDDGKGMTVVEVKVEDLRQAQKSRDEVNEVSSPEQSVAE